MAKHGNRSVSSRCGSADLLEACGVVIDLDPETLGSCLRETGICFLYAPALHPMMRRVGEVRKALGMRTIFNFLGPLTNPAGARRQVVGVFERRWVEPLAEVLLRLGAERALVVHGTDGADELTLAGETHVAEVRDGSIRVFRVSPEDFGLPRRRPEDLAGGDAEDNAAALRELLAGRPGALRDGTIMAASAALAAAGICEGLFEGASIAAEAIDSGRAARTLDRLAAFTRARAATGERAP